MTRLNPNRIISMATVDQMRKARREKTAVRVSALLGRSVHVDLFKPWADQMLKKALAGQRLQRQSNPPQSGYSTNEN